MRILSGINPSSDKGLHIGNYFGAVERFVKLQKDNQCFYFVANLHSLNTIFDAQETERNTLGVFAEYLALGIDPEKAIFFIESDIPEIPYLQTILNNCITVAELKRMHGYKDKLAKEVETDAISAGLFEYPVLMSADILLFSPDIIPVGDDQIQHVEITREIARTFNNRYGEIFKIPNHEVNKNASRVLGTDGKRKMSKSLGNNISIFSDEAVVANQIKSIITDPARIKPTDSGDPSKNICFTYLRLFQKYSDSDINELETRYRSGTIGDVEIKEMVKESFYFVFTPFRARKSELMANPELLQKLRKRGQVSAREYAVPMIDSVKKACGI
jgi:tryptophanyl-tRNA synthetase